MCSRFGLPLYLALTDKDKPATAAQRTNAMESDETSGKQIERRGTAKTERFLDFIRAAPSKDLDLYGCTASPSVHHRPARVLRRVATVRTRTGSLRQALIAPRAGVRAHRGLARTGRPVQGLGAAAHERGAGRVGVWLAFAVAGVAFVFLLMTGALNSAVPDASRRRRREVANQVLNALFTIMCVCQHPRLCHHLALLLRWHDADAAELRGVYCKNAAASPKRERHHVPVVLLLLHATCFAQYAYCVLFWAFSSETRPDWAVNFCMGFGDSVSPPHSTWSTARLTEGLCSSRRCPPTTTKMPSR